MRRPSSVEVMLLTAILLWSLNLTVTRYVLTHGFLPLAYSAVRYGLAALVFVGLTLAVERSLRISGRREQRLIAVAVVALVANQVCFVYALKTTTGVDDRADPRRDTDPDRADRALVLRTGAAVGPVLAGLRRVVRRGRARRRRGQRRVVVGSRRRSCSGSPRRPPGACTRSRSRR